MPIVDGPVQRTYRVRIVLICIVLVTGLLSTVHQGIQTLDRLNVVERERDQWQRPSEVIQALNLTEGSAVVDLGSGAGYFASEAFLVCR